MKFNLENLNPGTWFYEEDNDKKAGVCIRVATGDKLKEIAKKTKTETRRFKRGQSFTETKVNHDLHDKLLWDYCIEDWQGILDEKGKEIKPTAENKALLMGNAPAFANFVSECLDKLNSEETDRQEVAEKNS